MTQIILDTKNNKEASLLLEIAHRMNINGRRITFDLAEDIALAKAIDEGRKTKKVSRETIMKKLRG